MSSHSHVKNQSGQGLVEYLILVAILAVGTMGMVRIVGKNIQAGYGNIANVLNGNTQPELKRDAVTEEQVNKKNMSNFMNGLNGN